MIILVAGFTALLVGAYGTSYLVANQPAGGTPKAQQQGTKIAVVNIGQVFNQYKRAIAMKADLEQTLKPYKDKGKTLTDQIKAWEEELRKPQLDPAKALQYQESIKTNKRTLEDMSAEITRLLGKKQEDNLVTLWKEVNMGIDAVAKAYGFQIVLGYGDPMEKDLLNQFPNVNRKMQAMDLGSTVPLYVHGSVDLSQAIVDTLNHWIQPPDKKAVTPVTGTK
jgi:Skp family chaperone for outer membrane proteins